MDYYVKRHFELENHYYKKSIFQVWKKEYQGAKRLVLGTRVIFTRNFVKPAFAMMVEYIRSMDSKFKSQ